MMSICSATGVTMLFVMFDRPGIASRSDVFCWSSGWRKSRAATFFLTTLLRRRDAAASSSSSSCDAERGHGEDGNDDGVADDAAEQDLPLDLECTKRWEEGAHRAWDVVEELVRMRVFPAPANAFEVNHFALKHVPRDDRYLLTGALVAFLRDVAADEGAAATRKRNGNGNAFDAAVTRDVEKLVRSHFADVPERLRRSYT